MKEKETPGELDIFFEDIRTYQNSKNFKDLFQFIRRFPEYAPFNALLLHIQKPGSQFVLSARDWMKSHDRTIKPGARPLIILWPFMPVRFVFELGDTEGNGPFPDELLNPFKNSGTIDRNTWVCLKKNLPTEGIAFHEADQAVQSAGAIEPNDTGQSQQACGKHTVRVLYNLIVNRNHPIEVQFATVIHELGHLHCGHLGSEEGGNRPSRGRVTKEVKEFEAECVCWLVCERNGIQNPSAEYLSGYLENNGTIPDISIETILKATGTIETMMKSQMPPRKHLIINGSSPK